MEPSARPPALDLLLAALNRAAAPVAACGSPRRARGETRRSNIRPRAVEATSPLSVPADAVRQCEQPSMAAGLSAIQASTVRDSLRCGRARARIRGFGEFNFQRGNRLRSGVSESRHRRFRRKSSLTIDCRSLTATNCRGAETREGGPVGPPISLQRCPPCAAASRHHRRPACRLADVTEVDAAVDAPDRGDPQGQQRLLHRADSP